MFLEVLKQMDTYRHHRREVASVVLVQLHVGSSEPNKDKVGSLKLSDLQSIAELKMNDLNANTIEQAIMMIRGTCRSMGIEVK